MAEGEPVVVGPRSRRQVAAVVAVGLVDDGLDRRGEEIRPRPVAGVQQVRRAARAPASRRPPRAGAPWCSRTWRRLRSTRRERTRSRDPSPGRGTCASAGSRPSRVTPDRSSSSPRRRGTAAARSRRPRRPSTGGPGSGPASRARNTARASSWISSMSRARERSRVAQPVADDRGAGAHFVAAVAEPLQHRCRRPRGRSPSRCGRPAGRSAAGSPPRPAIRSTRASRRPTTRAGGRRIPRGSGWRRRWSSRCGPTARQGPGSVPARRRRWPRRRLLPACARRSSGVSDAANRSGACPTQRDARRRPMKSLPTTGPQIVQRTVKRSVVLAGNGDLLLVLREALPALGRLIAVRISRVQLQERPDPSSPRRCW